MPRNYAPTISPGGWDATQRGILGTPGKLGAQVDVKDIAADFGERLGIYAAVLDRWPWRRFLAKQTQQLSGRLLLLVRAPDGKTKLR